MELVKQSITDQLYDLLREQIIKQEIRTGEQINPRALAQEYGVSMMPVRDALGRLATNGLVSIKPRVGYYARVFSKREIIEIMEVRKLHEVYCVRECFDLINRELVSQIKQRMVHYELAMTRERFDETDELLHDCLIAASQNNYFIEHYSHVKDLVVLLRHLNLARIDQSHAEHKLIVDSILDGQREKAVNYLIQHLDNVAHSIIIGSQKQGFASDGSR